MESGKNIVVFGCDNTGKTTLAKYLVEKINEENPDVCAIYKKSLGPNKTKDEQIDFMRSVTSFKSLVVFDRYPIVEEMTSGIVLRGKNNFQDSSKELMEYYLKKIDCYIFCYPGLFDIVNWEEREQLDGVKENVLDLINQYNRFAFALKECGFNVIEYNYKADTLDSFYIKLKNALGGF